MSLRVSSLDLFCLHSHPVPNFMRRQRRDATGDIVSAAKGMDKLRLGINELVWWIDGTEARNIRQCVFGSNSYSQTDCSGVTYITYILIPKDKRSKERRRRKEGGSRKRLLVCSRHDITII